MLSSWPNSPSLLKLKLSGWGQTRQCQTCKFGARDNAGAITALWRARVKVRSAAAMETNGSANREPRPGDTCLGLPVYFSALRTEWGYLSRTEISNCASIHHWLTWYWSLAHLLFSTTLYYLKKNGKCLHTSSDPLFREPQRRLKEKNPTTFLRVSC